MGERDRSAVDIHFVAVQSELSLDRYVLWGKGLIDLDQIQVSQGETRLVERLPRRRRRSDSHDPRGYTGDTPRDQATHRRKTVSRGELGVGDDQRCRTVSNSAGVSRGHQAVFLEIGTKRCQGLSRGIRPYVLIHAELGFLASLQQRDRDDFVVELSLVPRRLRPRLASHRISVDFLAADVVFLGQVLGGLGHRKTAVRVRQRFPERVLERHRWPEPQAPAGAAHHVWRLAHRLGAAGQAHA